MLQKVLAYSGKLNNMAAIIRYLNTWSPGNVFFIFLSLALSSCLHKAFVEVRPYPSRHIKYIIRVGNQDMPLWYKDYFELEANESQQIQKESRNFPDVTKSRSFWEMRTAINPLSQASFMVMKKTETRLWDGPVQTNPLLLVSSICLPSHSLHPWKPKTFFFSYYFSVCLFSFVKMPY